MRAHLEDDKLAVLDAGSEGLDEAGRGLNILPAERDLRRRFDLAELAKRVMGDDGAESSCSSARPAPKCAPLDQADRKTGALGTTVPMIFLPP